MAGESSIAVKFTAEVTQLTAQYAQAIATQKDLRKSVADLAAEMLKLGDLVDSQMVNDFSKLTTALAATNIQVVTLRGALRDATKEAASGSGETQKAAATTVNYKSAIEQATGVNRQYSQSLREAAQSAKFFEQATDEAGNPKAGYEIDRATNSMHGLNFATAGVTREFIIMGHEILTGNWNRLGGSAITLLERVGGLHTVIGALTSPMGLAAIAGTALAGTFAFLTVKAAEAANALDRAKIAADFAGNADLTKEQIKKLGEEFAKLHEGTHAEGAKIAAELTAGIKEGTPALFAALGALGNDFAKAIDSEDGKKAAQELVRVFGETDGGAEKFAKSLAGVSQAQINAAHDADLSGKAHEIAAAKLDLLNFALQKVRPAIDAYDRSATSSVMTSMALAGMAEAGVAGETAMIDAQTESRTKQTAALKHWIDTLKTTPQTPEQQIKVGIETGNAINPQQLELEKAQAAVTKIQTGLAAVNEQTDQITVKKLNDDLAVAKEKLDALQFGPIMQRAQADVQKLASTWSGTQSALLAEQGKTVQGYLAQVQQTTDATGRQSKEELELRAEVDRLAKQQRVAAGAEAIADNREINAKIADDASLTHTQVLERQLAQDKALLAAKKLTAEQQTQLERTTAEAEHQLNTERGNLAIRETQDAIERVQASETLSRTQKLARERDLWAALLAGHKLNADQRIDVDRDYQRKSAELIQVQKAEALKAAQDVTDEARRGSLLRVAAAQAEEDKAVQLYGQGSEQQLTAHRRQMEAWREEIDQQITLQASYAKTNSEIARIASTAQARGTQRTGGKGTLLDLLGIDSAAQDKAETEITQLTTGLKEQMDTLRASFQTAFPAGDFDAAITAMNQAQASGQTLDSVLKQIGVTDDLNRQKIVENLDQARRAQAQYAAEVTRVQAQAAQDTQREWVTALQPISGAFSGMINGMLTTTQTWQQTVLRVADTLVSGLVNAGARGTTAWAAQELTKTAESRAGAAQRAAAENSESTGLIGMIGRSLSNWLGLETAKTAATTAGAADRTIINTGESIIASKVAVATGMAMISISAAEAAAAAFADSAMLGPEGLAAAPEAAGAAYATVMGYSQGMGWAALSAAGGLGDVPEDQLAFIHKQEMILPASIAVPLRAMLAANALPQAANTNAQTWAGGLPAAGASGDTYHITVQALDTASGAQFIQDHARTIVTALRGQVRNGAPMTGLR